MSLPSGAIRLNWIQSSGTQFVNSGVVPKSTLKIRLKFIITDTANAGIVGYMQSSSNGSNRFALFQSGGAWYLDFGSDGTRRITGGTFAANTRYDVEIGNRYIKDLETGENIISGSTVADFTGVGTVSVGCEVLSGIGRYYYCQIYNGDTLLRDMVPCKLSDGSVGLWDDVEGKFYGNSGTGTFVAGPAAEIVELEYIESSGTQYVDAGFVPNQDTRVVADFQFMAIAGATYGLFGSRVSADERAFTFGAAQNGSWYIGYSTGAAIATGDTKRHLLDFNKNNTLLDGAAFTTRPTATFSTPSSMFLFAYSQSGNAVMKSNSRLYFCQIYDNGLLVRDYIPAKTIEGEIGLYDRVFKEFYRNAGSGTFTAGPEMAHEGYTELEWVQSTGTQYIDTAFVANQDTRVVMDVTPTVVSGSNTFFGSRISATSNNYSATVISGTIYSYYNTSNSQKWTGVAGQRITIDKNKETTTISGTPQSYSYGSFTTPSNLLLLALYNNGTVQWYAQAKLYSCQIYDNGLLVRDYIPKRHPSGVVGLWDAVNERFYASATTTDLIAGPEKVTTPKAPANFRVVSEADTEVALAWDASENAVGYLVRQSGTVIADTQELAVTADIQPFGYYTFEVSAYNEHGEGERSTLAVFRTPDNPMLWLVTDRTTQDVATLNNKGVYQTADLNRVGSAVVFLKVLLESAGFVVNVSPKIPWKDTEWVDTAQAAQYLADIQELRGKQAVLPTTPATPATLAQLNHTRANHIEQILLDVYTQYLIMLTTRVAAGTATSGGDYL